MDASEDLDLLDRDDDDSLGSFSSEHLDLFGPTEELDVGEKSDEEVVPNLRYFASYLTGSCQPLSRLR